MNASKDLEPNAAKPGEVSADNSERAELRYTEDLDRWWGQWQQQTANDAQAALEASRADAETALAASRYDADRASEVASVQAMQAAYVTVAQGSLDRILTRLNVVTASIGAVTTVYTGLLALVYAVKPGPGRALSVVAIIPALFLGLALFLVTVYAAMLKKERSVGPLLPTGIGGQIAEIRLVTFLDWCFSGVFARSWALHAGIVSLGVGVASLPLPFVSLRGWQQVAILGAGLLLVAAAAILTIWTGPRECIGRWRQRRPPAEVGR